jgi:hypothetical protein
VNQAAVSKLERRTDMYVSTLQDVEISQFAAVKKSGRRMS